VAIKVSAKRFSERFGREARAIAALNHPTICHLYDVGPNYLVMEPVEGETLAARLKEGALPLPSVLQYGSQIADALAAAHAKGIVHRDLKPSNVMVQADFRGVISTNAAWGKLRRFAGEKGCRQEWVNAARSGEFAPHCRARAISIISGS
jgi:serine/threonine protein kinase